MDRIDQEPAATADKTRLVLQTPQVRVMEYVLPAGERHSWHHHSEVTDRFYCLAGEISVDLRDPPRTELLHPGETLTVTPGTVHRAGNPASGISRYLLVQGIGHYDYIKAA